MFVEDEGGALGAWDAMSDIEELSGQLDARGIREHGLRAGFQKAWPSIQRAFSRAASSTDAGKWPPARPCVTHPPAQAELMPTFCRAARHVYVHHLFTEWVGTTAPVMKHKGAPCNRCFMMVSIALYVWTPVLSEETSLGITRRSAVNDLVALKVSSAHTSILPVPSTLKEML